MCGRFTLTASGDEVADAFGLDEAPSLEPRYNIAPSQPVIAVVAPDGRRLSEWLRWGFVSRNARGRPLINARAESVGKGLFAHAFAQRRCLLPADGFYEWQAVAGGAKKQPHHIRLSGGGLFGLAGVFEPGADGISTCAILTTHPTDTLRGIHDRMPVILPPEAYATWLDRNPDRARLLPLLAPFTDQPLEAVAVGLAVNNARTEGPVCILPGP